MTCSHVGSGCNAPEGECLGFCLNKESELQYKTGMKLTCRDSGQVFVVSKSDARTTHYCGHGASGECYTDELTDFFIVDGSPLPTVGELLAKVPAVTPEKVDRFVRIGAGLFTSAACIKFLLGV